MGSGIPWVEGTPPPPLLPEAEHRDGVRPPPSPSRTALETWVSRGRGEGMQPGCWRGQVAAGDDHWVSDPSRRVQEGGGKQPSQLQLLSLPRNSATLPAPRAPPPRRQALAGAARCQGRGARATGEGTREMTELHRSSYITGSTYAHRGLEKNARYSHRPARRLLLGS